MNWEAYLGESSTCEKKQAVERRKPKSWLKSVSAFANSHGGTLIFGVADDGSLTGLNDSKGDSEFISQKIKERIDPVPEFRLELVRQGDRDFILVHVEKGEETPYFYAADGVMEAYRRLGNESVLAQALELRRLALRGARVSYDQLPTDYNVTDYSFSKLRERYHSWHRVSMPDTFPESYGLVNAEGKLTNAGALLADDSPMKWSRLSCVRWNGLTKAGGMVDALDSAEYRGSLISLLQEGVAFVKRNMRTLWKKLPTSRLEMPDYCERSVFEALVNALIHRDYLVIGSEVHIDMFDDRMEIYSPGGMYDSKPIQEQDITHIPSRRRNPVLADVFTNLGYMEKQGSGLKKIREAYQNAANFKPGMEPEFLSYEGDFFVTLRHLNYGVDVEKADELHNRTTIITLNDRQQTLLSTLRKNPELTLAEIVTQTGLTKSTAHREIQVLTELELLERIGSRKSGRWIVYGKADLFPSSRGK